MSASAAASVSWVCGPITSWRDFLRLRADWEQLSAQDPDGGLLSHAWHVQAWKCSPERSHAEHLLVFVVRNRDGECAAILPLRANARTRRLCFLDEARLQRQDLVASAGTAGSAWRLLADQLCRRRDWDRLDLQFLRPEGRALATEAFQRAGLAWRERGQTRQRYIRLGRPWEAIEAGFSPYLRANFRRRHKRLLALGPLTVCVHHRWPAAKPHLAACFDLEQRGWKGQQHTAMADNALLARFYWRLAAALAAKGHFRLYCLHVGERLAAFEFCIADSRARRLSSLKIAYEEQWHTASPGLVLRWLLLRDAYMEFERYEFLGDDAGWKGEWTSDFTELTHLRVYHRTWRGRLWQLRSQAARTQSRVYSTWRRLLG